MLYISTALYIEAQPFITLHSLKQLHEHTRFQVFANDSVCLIITGVGELKASIALTYLFSQKNIGPHDLFLNFGLCGSMNPDVPIGNAYLIDKLKDYATKRELYPDMLLKLPFPEASIETCPMPAGKDLERKQITEPFVDMESYAIMYAITYYMQPHQILFLKVVSDYANEENNSIIDKDMISVKLMQAAKEISSYLAKQSSEFSFFPQAASSSELSAAENSSIQTIIQKLHLSETMSYMLKQHIAYYKCRHRSADSILTECLAAPDFLACKNKTEGKKYFEQLKSKLME